MMKGETIEESLNWTRNRNANGKSFRQDSIWDKKDKVCSWSNKKNKEIKNDF